MNLAVNSLYGPVLQGEITFRPCFFLRLAGCNLHCSFCDTPYTWDWTGRNGQLYDLKVESHVQSVADVAERLLQLHEATPGVKRLVVSGGEPLLQQPALLALARVLHGASWQIEVETAGTIEPVLEIADQFNVSPKLSNSGNERTARLNPPALTAFAASGKTAFKFVIMTLEDLAEVDALVAAYGLRNVYVMAEGIDAETLDRRAYWLIPQAIARGYGYTPRLHIELYGNRRNV